MEVPVRKVCRSHLRIGGALTRAALAPIEKKMVRMLAHGISPRIIANRLALSDSNLRACLDSVFAKLAIAGQLGLLTSPDDRNRRSSFSLVRLAHRLAKKNSDRENDMQVA